MYQRTNEKLNPSINRTNNDSSRMAPAVANKQQPHPPQSPNLSVKQPPGVSSGLAAAVNNASRQETMMPGHRPREKAAGRFFTAVFSLQNKY